MERTTHNVDTPTTINVLSICSGYGGIELGIHAALAGRTRTVCYVENEIGASSQLALLMEKKFIDTAPIWTDLRTFDPEPWRGKIHLLAGGIPCQPHSTAGAQLQDKDPRELSGEVIRIAAGLGPPYPALFLENVPGILRFYWDSIRPQLREMGYSIEEGLFSAAETGAPHLRQRLFIMADTECTTVRRGCPVAREERQGKSKGTQRERVRPDSGASNINLADTSSRRSGGQARDGSPIWPPGREASEPRPNQRSGQLADPECVGRDTYGDNRRDSMERAREREPDRARGRSCHVADTDYITGLNIDNQRDGEERAREGEPGNTRCEGSALADPPVERLQGWDDPLGQGHTWDPGPDPSQFFFYPPGPGDEQGWAYMLSEMPEALPTICRENDGSASGVDRRLRLLGNGVIPLVAKTAFIILSNRLTKGGSGE